MYRYILIIRRWRGVVKDRVGWRRQPTDHPSRANQQRESHNSDSKLHCLQSFNPAQRYRSPFNS